MTREEAILCLKGMKNYARDTFTKQTQTDWQDSLDMAIEALKADSFYDGYVHCLVDFGWDTVLCKDCKHYKQSAVADRKMCFRKDVDGVEVCYDFLPYDSCTYGERKESEE